ncbi:PREDICTED: reticulon-like protein B12 [Tarenaya hassleriana]|uniref:reticulon-like protein B12 n=1 Tax=Tarenaya hassleriana TaxID=28532 RepID=UPI00053C8980|nr:PREDICTED: reticulon-like protein B12 [Tarenaya hassleriana]
MGSSSSSDRLFNRQRSVHQILGGGVAADVIMWRKRNVSAGIVTVTMASWLVFERCGYTFLSLSSSVLLLLLTILFLWSKSASILNRPAPPLPELHLTEEMAKEASEFLQVHVNKLLCVWQDIALGRDSKLFLRVAISLFLISFLGRLTDFPTLCHSALLVVMTIPAFYERYEDRIDGLILLIYEKSREVYLRLDIQFVERIRRWGLEKKKKLS